MSTDQYNSVTLDNQPPNPEVEIELEGSSSGAAILRTVLAIPVATLGVYACKMFADVLKKNEDGGGWLIMVVLCFLIAACLPKASRKLLDLGRREWIHLTYYAGFRTSKHTRSFDEFDTIVLRHLVHDGEGESAYTGGVGLRPRSGGEVLWVKEFKATPDEISSEAIEFAREMSTLTGFPLHRPKAE